MNMVCLKMSPPQIDSPAPIFWHCPLALAMPIVDTGYMSDMFLALPVSVPAAAACTFYNHLIHFEHVTTRLSNRSLNVPWRHTRCRVVIAIRPTAETCAGTAAQS